MYFSAIASVDFAWARSSLSRGLESYRYPLRGRNSFHGTKRSDNAVVKLAIIVVLAKLLQTRSVPCTSKTSVQFQQSSKTFNESFVINRLDNAFAKSRREVVFVGDFRSAPAWIGYARCSA